MARQLLIIGGTGQLGNAVHHEFRSSDWEVSVPLRSEFDVEEEEVDIARKIHELRPDVVVNCAWLPVIDCDNDPERAYRVNALGAYAVAKGSRLIGATTVYISTDFVFDGANQEGFAESDCPSPLNVYGASKLSGEQLTAIGNPRYFVVRTSALFGVTDKPFGNFVLKMKARAEAGQMTTVVNDQSTRPTFAEDIAPIIRRMIERPIPFGVYHMTNSGVATWYDFAKRVFDKSGRSHLVLPIQTATEASAIIRPRYSVLRADRLRTLGFPDAPTWEDALARYLRLVS